MVESQQDKTGGNPFSWKDNEKPHRNKMLNTKLLFDPLTGNKTTNPRIWYTQCNFQHGPSWIYSRLDQFYGNKIFFSFLPDKQNNIILIMFTTFSNHRPIYAYIRLNNAPVHIRTLNSKFILNSNLLHDEDVLATIQIIFHMNKFNSPNYSQIDRWKMNLPAWQCFLKTIGQKKAKDQRFIEKHLSSYLQEVENNIQNNPSDIDLVFQVISTKNALRKHQQIKIYGANVRSHAHWIQDGGHGSKLFFNLIKHKQSNESIDRFLIENQDTPDLDTINKAFADYYKNLFTSEDSKDAGDLKTKCKPLFPNRLDSVDMAILSEDISLDEIEKSIKALNNDKALGPDGLPIEFYKANISRICKDLQDIYLESLVSGSFGPCINSGIIKLLPKDRDKALIKN